MQSDHASLFFSVGFTLSADVGGSRVAHPPATEEAGAFGSDGQAGTRRLIKVWLKSFRL
jgi:hypothetical protein